MSTPRTAIDVDIELLGFAGQLHEAIGAARVLLFGWRSRGQEHPESDFDVIVVASYFHNIEFPRRTFGLRKYWYAAGGEGSMDLICLTREEFEDARRRPTLIAAVLPEAIDLLAAA